MKRKSSDRQRADAEFGRIWRPLEPEHVEEPPAPETRMEKTSRLKAVRLAAERKSVKPG